jgi:c-di-GMP-binding flagellar brake protein YcgR
MALGVAGVDHPEDRAVVDVIVPGRGEMLMSWVEAVHDAELVVTVAQTKAGHPVLLDAGERLDLVWKGPEGLRAMPVELTATERGERPAWRLRPMGPATRGQRRGAVRTPLRLTVRIAASTTELGGATVDVSESGLRVIFDRPAGADRPSSGPAANAPVPADDGSIPAPAKRPLPEVGEIVSVVLQLDDSQIAAKCEVIRFHPRQDDKCEASLRFIGLSEYEQDQIRARVFAEMRDLRRRGVI